MNKKTNSLKAAIVVAIALALIVPGAAMATNMKTQEIKETPYAPISMEGGWVEQASGFWEPQRGINFMDAVDEDTAWAVGYDGSPGGGVYETMYTKTTDGGDLWEADIIFMGDGYGLGNICGLDGDTAWAAVFSTSAQDEDCGIYKTTNGGDTWTHPFEGPYSFANNVWFFDENEGVCMGDLLDDYFEVYTSDDGGDTWTRVPEESFSGVTIDPGEAGWTGCMDAIGDTVLFGSNKGNVFISHDRGHTWTGSYSGCSTSGLNAGVNEIAFKDANHGLAAHDNGISYDIYTTSDGGDNWEEITPSGFVYGAGLSYVPGTDNMYISTGGAEFYSGASYSFDGGQSWEDYPEVAGTQLLSCDFVEGGVGWAGSFNDDEFTGGMFKYTPSAEPDLHCSGDIAWVDVTPGETVTDSFTVQNVGGDGSLLDWEIESSPDWGNWTFDPENGIDLEPGSPVTVNVEVIAPGDEETEFTGEIVLVNSEDSEDTCTIDVALTTPVSQESPIFQFLERIFERFPNAFPILRHLLGL
ncbi:MAG: hypothetical protein V3V27_02965 [Candidatus Thermoplasmatota archaeon]